MFADFANAVERKQAQTEKIKIFTTLLMLIMLENIIFLITYDLYKRGLGEFLTFSSVDVKHEGLDAASVLGSP